jgi:3-isopropylmalate dehydrogenase
MLLRHSFGLEAEAGSIENAVKRVLAAGYRTGDLAKKGTAPVSTQQMGDCVVQQLRSDRLP